MKFFPCNIIIICLSLLFACKPAEIKDSKAYVKYLSEKDNGLVYEKAISGIKYKVKYLPAEYLAYNTLSGIDDISETSKDSVIQAYATSLTFLLNIGPDDKEDFDITKVGISSYEEFASRIETMAFETQEFIKLEANGKTYTPSIVRMENLNALERSRNFVVVFSCEKDPGNELRSSDLCFCYDDEMFNTGVNKFVFKSADLTRIPKFKF